jgi:hypothetical protein
VHLVAGLLGGGSNTDALSRAFMMAQMQKRITGEDKEKRERENQTRKWIAQYHPEYANAPIPIAMELIKKGPKQRRIVQGPGGKPFYEDGTPVLPKVEWPEPSPFKDFTDQVKTGGQVRKEFQDITKPYRAVRDSYNRIQASATNPSPAGDLAMIFNYMKMLDPGSVVRESEFATAATAKPLLERLGISFDAVSAVWEGKKLTPEQRNDFLSRAQKLYSVQSDQYSKTADQYRELAKRYNLDPSNIVLDFTHYEAPAESPEAAPMGNDPLGIRK